MTEEQNKPTPGKGKAFFDSADEVAETGNWDYAIEMYTQGIAREPDNLERGHKKLRQVALQRTASGGKKPGMREELKHRPGKDKNQNVANAAYLLAKEPGSEKYMEQLLKAAADLDLKELAGWVGQMLLESQRQAKKPNKRVCVLLVDTQEKTEHYDQALSACQLAFQANPNDQTLEHRLGELSAKLTLQKGKYGEEGDFTKGVKDIDKQQQLMQQDAMVQDKSYLEQQVDKARAGYLEDPTVPGKVNSLVDALLKFEDEAFENEAIDVLKKAYQDTKAFQFKMRIGDIRIRQYTRRFRKLKEKGDIDNARKLAREQLDFEINEYRERVENYPTDISLKYELGRRLYLAGQYDDAIGYLQQAQRDPRRHVVTMNYLGQAFMKKQWWREAIDTFEKVLGQDVSEERAKEIRYSLGQCYEQQGDLDQAQEQYSQVAQADFNFKDVRDRLETVRKKIKESGAS